MKVSFSPFPPSLPAFPLSLPPSPPFLPQVPTWHFNGFDYPYYNVEMIDGSSCDIRGNNPRSVSILYICQTDAPTLGMVCVCACMQMFVHVCAHPSIILCAIYLLPATAGGGSKHMSLRCYHWYKTTLPEQKLQVRHLAKQEPKKIIITTNKKIMSSEQKMFNLVLIVQAVNIMLRCFLTD